MEYPESNARTKTICCIMKLPPNVTIKLETMQQAQSAPTPATIFSLFYNGSFVTTDISACMDSRFDKIVKL